MANILGINLSELNASQAQKKIVDWLDQSGSHYVVTPNPEIILTAHQDEELFYILNKADLALADGFGLKIAAKLFGFKIPRVTGSDLTINLLQLVEREGAKVIILNWIHGLSSREKITAGLSKYFPQLKYLILDISRDIKLSAETIKTINDYSGKLLFCALGAPYQEKIIYHNLKDLPAVKVALGVGGSFDFISGQVKRAPKTWRYLGLEWLFRLIQQPKRYRRIFRATFVFMSKVISARFINRRKYRQNVACFLFRYKPQGVEILIVEREDAPGHWQLPQGGTDGEDIETAGKRELKEEVGVVNIKTVAIFPKLHRYDFVSDAKKEEYRRHPQYQAKMYKFDYKGQEQGLYIAEFLGKDEEISINFWDHKAWQFVPINKFISSLHPVRQKAAKIFLEKFQSLNLNN